MALRAPKSERRMTLAEYLRMEETSEVKHEFHADVVRPSGETLGKTYPSGDAMGEVLAMSGGTYKHARVATNLTATLHQRLKGSSCQALDSNMRVATTHTGRFAYPEASIICGPPRFHPDDPNQTTVVNPRVIFEVLRELTEGYDRGEKFNDYRRIESLEEYILLAQDRPLVEGFLRQHDGTWSMATWEDLDDVAQVRCVPLGLPLTELYAGVKLDAEEADEHATNRE